MGRIGFIRGSPFVTDPLTDEELMRAYLGGDERAFEALYRRHSPNVYGYLRRKLPDRASADEVFQSVFLKLHQTRRNYDPAYPFAQWLFVVARTTLFDHFRKAGRQVPVADLPFDEERVSQNPPPPALTGEKEWEALNRLPPEQRQAIEMRVIDERSYEEIADKLNRTPLGVRQLVSRGLRKLRLARGKS